MAKTNLPVLLPLNATVRRGYGNIFALGRPLPRLRIWHGAALIGVVIAFSLPVQADAAAPPPKSFIDALIIWAPLLLKAFVFNILISVTAMAIGTVAGTFLGVMQVSLSRTVRGLSWFVTQFFRNAPWLVLMFLCVFLLPLHFSVFGITITLPDWIKATIGLALPVMSNVSEIIRGAVASIPSGQWEAAYSLAFPRRQVLFGIILPQCIRRMLPPWMNLYAILTMATVLASIVGVSEVMTQTQRVLSAENQPAFVVPFYAFVLLLFFIYCYPIARYTHRLELRYAVQD